MAVDATPAGGRPAGEKPAEEIEALRFALRCLEAAGAVVHPPGPDGTCRVDLPHDLASRWGNPWSPHPPLRLGPLGPSEQAGGMGACRPGAGVPAGNDRGRAIGSAGAGIEPEIEPERITARSERFAQLSELARQRGWFGCWTQRLPASSPPGPGTPGVQLVPYLYVELLLRPFAPGLPSLPPGRLLHRAVDLVSGRVVAACGMPPSAGDSAAGTSPGAGTAASAPDTVLPGRNGTAGAGGWSWGPPPRAAAIRPRRLGIRRALALVREHLAAGLEAEDHSWALPATEALAAQVERLERFFSARASEAGLHRTVRDDGDEDAVEQVEDKEEDLRPVQEEFERRLDEMVARWRPILQVHLTRAALVYRAEVL